jgi:hypothetical protein
MRLVSAALVAFMLAACAPNAGSSLPYASSAARDLVSAAGSSTTPNVGGCQIFPAPTNPIEGQAWWNTDISDTTAYPAAANSDQIIASLPGNLHPDFGHEPYYGIPFNVVPKNQKLVPIVFVNYASQSNKGPYPIPAHPEIEGEPRYNGGDRHLLILQQGTCKLYEMWRAVAPGNGNNRKTWSAANGAVFDLNSTALRPNGWTSADAAGLPIMPALIKCDEVKAGAINHALRVTFNDTDAAYIHPATHFAGSTNTSLPPMGMRMRLKSSYKIPASWPAVDKIILTAMQKFGMFVADNGSNWYFQGQGGKEAACWNDNQLDFLKNVPGSAFEAVATGPELTLGE